jgi:group I intron endonuclease
MFTIYKIINKINNKFYVGYTTKLPAKYRYSGHISSMKRGSKLPIHCAMRKHGLENFSLEILEMGENHEYGYKVAPRVRQSEYDYLIWSVSW